MSQRYNSNLKIQKNGIINITLLLLLYNDKLVAGQISSSSYVKGSHFVN